MPYIAPEVITEAKRMDLLTYLRTYEPGELVRYSGNTYCTREHDSLKISNGKWMWWSRGIGGKSALDYLIKVKGLDFVEAVETIMGQCAVSTPVYEKKAGVMKISRFFYRIKVRVTMWLRSISSVGGLIMKS